MCYCALATFIPSIYPDGVKKSSPLIFFPLCTVLQGRLSVERAQKTVSEFGYRLWHGDEPEGGTEPLGSITKKGLALKFLILFLFIFFLFRRPSLFKNNGIEYLTSNFRYFAGCATGGAAVSWVSLSSDRVGYVKETIKASIRRRQMQTFKVL